jgi:hypothetical protein
LAKHVDVQRSLEHEPRHGARATLAAAYMPSVSGTRAGYLRLQSAAGNNAVARAFTSLPISQPNDQGEMRDHVVGRIDRVIAALRDYQGHPELELSIG